MPVPPITPPPSPPASSLTASAESPSATLSAAEYPSASPPPAHALYYLLGSYRSATAPEANSRRLTSFKSRGFDSPASNVGPWPASLGCTTNSYSSISLSSANASGSFTPPTNNPLPAPPDSRLSCSTPFARSPRKSSAFQSTWLKVLDTTYFLAASIVRAKGSIHSAIHWGRSPFAGHRHAACIIS